jgi:hypothetical protein
MQDVVAQPKAAVFRLTHKRAPGGEVLITAEASGTQKRSFTLRTENLIIDGDAERVAAAGGKATWRARVQSQDTPWVAVVMEDGDAARRRSIASFGPLPTDGK